MADVARPLLSSGPGSGQSWSTVKVFYDTITRARLVEAAGNVARPISFFGASCHLVPSAMTTNGV